MANPNNALTDAQQQTVDALRTDLVAILDAATFDQGAYNTFAQAAWETGQDILDQFFARPQVAAGVPPGKVVPRTRPVHEHAFLRGMSPGQVAAKLQREPGINKTTFATYLLRRLKVPA